MAYWRAITTCHVQGVYLPGNSIVFLSDAQEKAEKLGKYAEKVPDQKALRRDATSKKTIEIGNKNLVKVKASEVAELEGKDIDGVVLFPPPESPVKKGSEPGISGAHATTFQTIR